jgi:hypothetical protein
MLEDATRRLLDPSTMHPLQVERETVDACEVFYDPRVWKSLQQYTKTLKLYEKAGELPDSIANINTMTVPDDYIHENLSHQDVTGRQIIEQGKLIANAEFFKALTSHPDFKIIPGFEKPVTLMSDTVRMLNLLRKFGNFFRKHKVHTMLGSPAEVKIAQQCYERIWPPGINLYSILREMYLVFHARLTGQIPVCVAENLENLLNTKVDRNSIHGIGRFTVDDNGRFLGLYSVAEVPEAHVTLDSQFVSQDQLGRRAIAQRILNDAIKILRENNDQKLIVIDYAGGVGNISEMLLKKIYALPEDDMQFRLMNQLRIAVIDIADDQLAAGQNRFFHMSQKPELKGINDKIIFLKGDITRALSEEQLKKIREKFGPDILRRTVYLGMTAYTTGSLNNLSTKDGTTYVHAMADEMFKQCCKIYAVDFSSPMWRLKDFLRDTGRWGKEYLRNIHGVADQKDENTPLNRILAAGLKLRYGLHFSKVADFVRFMSAVPGLASHYCTVWPDSDGHNSGYTLQEDASLKKPSILSFAERLQGYGANVFYKSKVWLFVTMDLGRIPNGKRAWAFMPGWVADFVVAENEKNNPV